ncbi:hypothetical protein T484DRAFT_1815868 [Baffinella frigidus]|nr:hypothetical protein T484DRAFT_1815868 [Cryptophyta sp. CCMP2293]
MAAHTPSAGAREPGGDTAEEPPALRRLLERIENRTCVVGVMGLGYVGLPLANTFHAAGFRTLGFDTEEDVVASLTAGRSYPLTS